MKKESEWEETIQQYVEQEKDYDFVLDKLDLPVFDNELAMKARLLGFARKKILDRNAEIHELRKQNLYHDLRARFDNLPVLPKSLKNQIVHPDRKSLKLLETDGQGYILFKLVAASGRLYLPLLVSESIPYDKICKIALDYESSGESRGNKTQGWIATPQEIQHVCKECDESIH